MTPAMIVLGNQLATFLSPFLPLLLEMDRPTAVATEDRTFSAAWTAWRLLRPGLDSTSPSVEITIEAIARGQTAGSRFAFAQWIARVLGENPALARQLTGVITEVPVAVSSRPYRGHPFER